MRILVTGGLGFVGSHLCNRLAETGHEVVSFDNVSTGVKDNVSGNVKVISGDCNNREQIEKVIAEHKPEALFHYAFTVGVERTEEDPITVLSDIEGIKNVLELGRKHDIKKMIFASSSEVYGDPIKIPESETDPVKPEKPYAAIKFIGEVYFRNYFNVYGIDTCSLRLFNVYGPRQLHGKYGFVVGTFIKQALNNEPLTVFGDGKQTRDFTFIKDNIEATIRTLDKKMKGVVLNIGSGKETSVLDLAKTIIDVSGKEINPVFLSSREGEIQCRVADIKRMREILEFETKYTLRDGLKETYEWYKNQR